MIKQLFRMKNAPIVVVSIFCAVFLYFVFSYTYQRDLKKEQAENAAIAEAKARKIKNPAEYSSLVTEVPLGSVYLVFGSKTAGMTIFLHNQEGTQTTSYTFPQTENDYGLWGQIIKYPGGYEKGFKISFRMANGEVKYFHQVYPPVTVLEAKNEFDGPVVSLEGERFYPKVYSDQTGTPTSIPLEIEPETIKVSHWFLQVYKNKRFVIISHDGKRLPGKFQTSVYPDGVSKIQYAKVDNTAKLVGGFDLVIFLGHGKVSKFHFAHARDTSAIELELSIDHCTKKMFLVPNVENGLDETVWAPGWNEQKCRTY